MSSFRFSTRFFYFFALALVLLGLTAWFSRTPEPTYATATVNRGDVQASVAAVATLLPRDSVDVTSRTIMRDVTERKEQRMTEVTITLIRAESELSCGLPGLVQAASSRFQTDC